MKKFLILLVTGMLYFNISYSEIVVTTDGRTIDLKSDGTYEIIEKKEVDKSESTINISDLIVNAEWTSVRKTYLNLQYSHKAVSNKSLPLVTTCILFYDKNNKKFTDRSWMDMTFMEKDEFKVFEYSYTVDKDEWNKAHTFKFFLAEKGCSHRDFPEDHSRYSARSNILEFAKEELMDESEENSISESTTSSKSKVSKTLGICNFSVDEINKLGFSYQKFPSSKNPTDTGTMILCGSLPGTNQSMVIFVNPTRVYVYDVLENGYCIYLKQGRIDKVNNQQECQY